MDGKVVATQEHVDNILAQVVDIACNRAQQDAPRGLARDLTLYDGLDYTSRGHKLRFFKELKAQGKQRL